MGYPAAGGGEVVVTGSSHGRVPAHRLPNDTCRCAGEGCDRRERCLRFLDGGTGGHVACAYRVCETDRYEAFIPAPESPGVDIDAVHRRQIPGRADQRQVPQEK